MYKIKTEIEGLTPILMNNRDVKHAVTVKEPGSYEPDRIEQIARTEKVYHDDKVGFYVPSKCIMSCLIGVGGAITIKKAGAAALIGPTCQIVPQRISLNKDEIDEMEWAYVRRPPTRKTAPKVLDCWAAFVDWKLSFEMTVADEVIPVTPEYIRAVFDFAGYSKGLLDRRAVGFGRFKVTNWEVMSSQFV